MPADAPDGAPARRVHLAWASATAHLEAELRRALPRSSHVARSPFAVESAIAPEEADAVPALAFAVQTLPFATPVSAPSIKAWAGAIFERMMADLRDHEGPVRLHVFRVGPAAAEPVSRRCLFVLEEIEARLHKKQRRLLRARVAAEAPVAEDEAHVQAALEGDAAGWVSVALPPERRRLRRVLSRFPAGIVRVPGDRRPPSRAFRKLVEAEAHLGRTIARGETCVDLGASPGSWSFVALERGARVTAVDRSPLRDDLMRREGLRFVEGDAFRFEPAPAPVDWLLCDVIAFPERTIELLDRWLARGLCRRFVATVKFRGADDYAKLEEVKRVLERRGAEFVVRQILENKNEVTALGAARGI